MVYGLSPNKKIYPITNPYSNLHYIKYGTIPFEFYKNLALSANKKPIQPRLIQGLNPTIYRLLADNKNYNIHNVALKECINAVFAGKIIRNVDNYREYLIALLLAGSYEIRITIVMDKLGFLMNQKYTKLFPTELKSITEIIEIFQKYHSNNNNKSFSQFLNNSILNPLYRLWNIKGMCSGEVIFPHSMDLYIPIRLQFLSEICRSETRIPLSRLKFDQSIFIRLPHTLRFLDIIALHTLFNTIIKKYYLTTNLKYEDFGALCTTIESYYNIECKKQIESILPILVNILKKYNIITLYKEDMKIELVLFILDITYCLITINSVIMMDQQAIIDIDAQTAYKPNKKQRRS
jgi:hypothetical protein